MRKIINVVLLLSLLVSCTRNENEKVPCYQITLQAVGEDDYVLGAGSEMAANEDFILIEEQNTDSLIHVIDVKNGAKHIGRIGEIGQGPEEFLIITNICTTADKKGFCAYDANRKILWQLKHTENGWEQIKLFEPDSLFHRVIKPLNDSTYLASGYYNNHKFFLLSKDGDVLNRVGEWPYRDEAEKKVSGVMKSQAYVGDFTVSPSGKNVVYACLASDILSFYTYSDLELSLNKEIVNEYVDYNYRHDSNHFSGTSRKASFGYLSIASNNNYVYLLYSGRSIKEYDLKAFQGNSIHVYTWEGKKVAELKSESDLDRICMSPDGDKLYAVALVPDYRLVEISLPEVLQD